MRDTIFYRTFKMPLISVGVEKLMQENTPGYFSLLKALYAFILDHAANCNRNKNIFQMKYVQCIYGLIYFIYTIILLQTSLKKEK